MQLHDYYCHGCLSVGKHLCFKCAYLAFYIKSDYKQDTKKIKTMHVIRVNFNLVAVKQTNS